MTYRQWEIPFDALSDRQMQAHDYWVTLNNSDSLPKVSDFELLKCPLESIPLIHIVDVIDGGNEFQYQFWGSGFRDHLGYDGTGLHSKDLRPQQIIDPVRTAYSKVVAERRAIAMMSEFERGKSADILGFQRFMRLPLMAESGEVGQVVSVVEFLQDYHDSQSIITEFSGEQF